MQIPLGAFLFSLCALQAQTVDTENTDPPLRIWFDSPAAHFEQALVMGNGKMGISIFGGVGTDSIYLNDITLWSGEPVADHLNPKAQRYIPLIRKALEGEDYQAADSLSRFVQGPFSQSYLPLGTLYIEHHGQGEPTHYHRELDLERAVSTVGYRQNGVGYQRRYWVSHPDRLMVMELEADQGGALDFTLGFDSPLPYRRHIGNEGLTVHGHAPYHVEPNYRGDMPNAILYHPLRGTRFAGLVQVKETDGTVLRTKDGLRVKGASHAVLLLSTGTSFNGFDKDPAREGGDPMARAMAPLEKGLKKSVADLLNDHLEDYRGLFDRVSLNLGPVGPDTLATDQRLLAYAHGAFDPYLEALYFQFGRYLLISSSRTPEVPANLQGLWNPYIRPPWSSNYTININAQENYWLAEIANLSELHGPLLSWIKNVSRTGAVSARDFLGVQRGWMAAHNSDIWAMSNPVGDFGQGDPVWANWYLGGAWLSTHIWEHYSFSRDRAFLDAYYPILKGAAEFSLDWLIERDGELISSPGSSPENVYITPQGYHGATLYGATADLAIIRELFLQTIKAARVLDRDPGFARELGSALERLRPYQVGHKGNLQEWYHDWEDAEPHHRHQTHLFGLYPGHHINPEDTPGLVEAAQRALEIKGDESTGWSKGWRINLWARLRDGEQAYKMYRDLLAYVDPDGMRTERSGGGGTYPNLLDAHPPFQIDGNFGGAAGVVEMLLQSSDSGIELLPALPEAWPSGAFKGLCARGGFELDLVWEDRAIKSLKIRSRAGNPIHLKWQGQSLSWETRPGETYFLDKNFTFRNAQPTRITN